MTEATLNGMTDLDSLLYGTLDDLADMPEFKPFPIGAHKVKLTWDYSELKEKKCIKLTATYIEPVELADPSEVPPKAGDSTNNTYFLVKTDGTKNEYNEGAWKNMLAGLKDSFPGSPREIMDASQGAEVLLITKLRADKRDKNDIKYYTDFVSVAVI